MPWCLSADSLQPVLDPYPETPDIYTLVNGVVPEHYFTERHAIHFIADFIAALKKFGVYDNTRIVIFSDHGEGDSWKLRNVYPNYPGRPNALMLIKDFNSTGPMRTSDALMSCEDVPALLLDGIARVDGIPSMEELKSIAGPDRVRTHFCSPHWRQPMDEKYFRLTTLYQVKGTMFRKENWSIRLESTDVSPY